MASGIGDRMCKVTFRVVAPGVKLGEDVAISGTHVSLGSFFDMVTMCSPLLLCCCFWHSSIELRPLLPSPLSHSSPMNRSAW